MTHQELLNAVCTDGDAPAVSPGDHVWAALWCPALDRRHGLLAIGPSLGMSSALEGRFDLLTCERVVGREELVGRLTWARNDGILPPEDALRLWLVVTAPRWRAWVAFDDCRLDYAGLDVVLASGTTVVDGFQVAFTAARYCGVSPPLTGPTWPS